MEIPEEKMKEYFKDNYAIVTHIYFNVPATQKEDGTYVSPSAEEKENKKSDSDAINVAYDRSWNAIRDGQIST